MFLLLKFLKDTFLLLSHGLIRLYFIRHSLQILKYCYYTRTKENQFEQLCVGIH